MSEYQYYEFLALDRPLAPKQIDEVGQFSTRADISATRFVNVYHWGDFRGDPDHFIKRYFDVMVYVANWGTHRLLMGMPMQGIDLKSWRQYESGDGLEIRKAGDRLILDISSQTEDPDGMDEGERWMPSLAPLRDELLSGDLRALYLAALAGLYIPDDESEDEDSDDSLPPVPPGLAKLTAAQQALTEFLRVDQDLLAAVGRNSPPIHPPSQDLASWIASLPQHEKDEMLIRLATDEHPRIGPELLRRYRLSTADAISHSEGQLAAELVRQAKKIRDARQTEERNRAEQSRQRRAAEKAAARAQYLAQLASRQEKEWRQIDDALKLKKANTYDLVVTKLCDLREIAVSEKAIERFAERMQNLRARHLAKYSLMQRLEKAGL